MKFDEGMKQLNKIIEELESPKIELEKSIDLFKTGKELIQQLNKQLTDIETKIVKIISEEDEK